MAVVNGGAVLQQHGRHPSLRAALAVGAAAVLLVGYFVVSSSITVLRPDVCGRFVSDAPAISRAVGDGWLASPPHGANVANPFLRVGFVDHDGSSGPVLHSLTGAELPLRPARSGC
ncbi:hypothetical protein [Microlunatus soli]|uniref:Uncharacterized protein n=1 Tax=Microlunatus soli TaxID=630515 RepID=A0A1H1YJ29_9ACTN|nr:hypothetical protein [Microlunatus soli]SDT21460.1 hypothetical protein SAMN04489812_4610 [Microlunatus soli]